MILMLLPLPELLRAKQVNKQWQAVCKASSKIGQVLYLRARHDTTVKYSRKYGYVERWVKGSSCGLSLCGRSQREHSVSKTSKLYSGTAYSLIPLKILTYPPSHLSRTVADPCVCRVDWEKTRGGDLRTFPLINPFMKPLIAQDDRHCDQDCHHDWHHPACRILHDRFVEVIPTIPDLQPQMFFTQPPITTMNIAWEHGEPLHNPEGITVGELRTYLVRHVRDECCGPTERRMWEYTWEYHLECDQTGNLRTGWGVYGKLSEQG